MPETKRPHGSRFRDALVIVNPGACNPSGIAHSIVDACREIREHEPLVDTGMIRQDPAIRLMTYQLAHLIAGLSADDLVYGEDVAYCKRRLDELGLRRIGTS